MAQDRKYLGMTLQQIGILGGLALIVLILLCAISLLFLRRGTNGLFARAPQSTPTIPATATMIVIPTSTPTETPTPVPYEQLIPTGWKQFKTKLVEIWLPPEFKNAKKNPDEELAASNPISKTTLTNVRVNVGYEPLTGDSIDAYLDDKLSKFDSSMRLVERRKVFLNSTEAIRMVIEGHVKTWDVNELVYIIPDGDTVWSVVYFAEINDFYEMLPTFEQSAKTFRIVK